MNRLYTGGDVSLDFVDVAIAITAKMRQAVGRFANNLAGWQEMARALQALAATHHLSIIHLVIEPTGGYEAGLLYFAYEQGWQVTRVNPLQVRRWAEGQGMRAKTDRQDALLLAWYGVSRQSAPQEPMDPGAVELDEILRRRTDLEQLQRAEKNRLGQAQRKPHTPRSVLHSLERTLRTLEEELKALDEAIKQLLKERPDLNQQRRLLCSLPAIGQKLSLEMLVLCHRFWAYTKGQGTGKQLVAFVGLDPQPHESGKSKHHPSISHQGNAHTRSQLYCGALGGVRGDNPLHHFYHRLLASGKAKKLALVACARKVLTWVWAIFTSNTPFDASRFSIPETSHA